MFTKKTSLYGFCGFSGRLAAVMLSAALFLCTFACPGALADNAEEPALDLMLIAAHPGDEVSFFSGLLAVYAGELGYSTKVVYTSCKTEKMRNTACDTLKKIGVTEEPVFLDYSGVYFENLAHAKKQVSMEELEQDLVRILCAERPSVVVTHDPEGEFGHGMHILTAECTRRAVKTASEGENPFRGCRLYFHSTASENASAVNRTCALEKFGGKSVLEVDEALYAAYSTDILYPRSISTDVYTQGFYSPEDGQESTGGRNLFSGTDREKPADGILFEAVVPEKKQRDIDADGIFSEEETVVFDEEAGHYEYKSSTFSCFIERKSMVQDNGDRLTYNAAHLYMKENAFVPGILEAKRLERLYYMARRYKAVVGISGDNLKLDKAYKGIIIRDGKVYLDKKEGDTMAILPDMSLEIYERGTVTAEELLEKGIRNTFSFGPTLIHKGLVNHDVYRPQIMTLNPRCGIGMVEPGHLVLITVDGRQNDYSKGLRLDPFCHLFYAEGCTEAYNLDGGRSVAMVFMGEHINHHTKVGSDSQRKVHDGLLFGYSERVPDVKDPVYNIGYGRSETPIRVRG